MAKTASGIGGLGQDLDEQYYHNNGFVHPSIDKRVIDSYKTIVKPNGPLEMLPLEFTYEVRKLLRTPFFIEYLEKSF